MPKRRHPFQRSAPSPIHLTDDDITITRFVAEHRFRRTSDIIRRLSHRSPAKIRNRLRPLYDHGYLDRPLAQRQDHVSHGKQEYIYALGNQGAKLLNAIDGTIVPKSNWTQKNKFVQRPHIQHTLQIADITDAVDRLPRHQPDMRIIPALDILATAPPATQQDAKPWQWTATIAGSDASYSTASLIPDFVFGIDVTTARQHFYFFTEADRGTEPVVRRSRSKQSSIERKFATYLAGLHARHHTTRYGIGNLRILFATTSRQRINTMLSALRTTAAGADTSMFFFTENTALRSAGHILDAPWINSAGQRVALFPRPQPTALRSLQPCL